LARINPNEYFDRISKFGTVIKCFEGNRISGAVIMYANNFETKVAYITLIATIPQFRGHGVASLLLDSCTEIARSKGMKKIGIHTNNVVARNLYIKKGFAVNVTTVVEGSSLFRYYLEKVI
jgi:ribosomal protein S18 acetylase RimI-like enzyme